LYDFKPGFDPADAATSHATVSLLENSTEGGLKVMVHKGHPWPGITLPAPDGSWNLSPHAQVELHLSNPGHEPVAVHCRVDNPGADGVRRCATGRVTVEAGGQAILRVPLNYSVEDTMSGKLFGLRGYPVKKRGGDAFDPLRVNQLIIFVPGPDREKGFVVHEILANGTWARPTAWTDDATPYFPLIDTFGQYRHQDWPGKVTSLNDLKHRKILETKELKQHPAPRDWNTYGGWLRGPKLEGSGFFRTTRYEGKWWLVDPEGYLFWSHGIDCVRMFDVTAVEERETWFQAYPGDQPEFSEFVVKGAYALKGHYAGRRPGCFSFAGANLKRKYGSTWKQVVPELIHRRLRSWGMNTIGNWSDGEVRRMRRTPYTDNISSGKARRIEGSEGYWGQFPDVFDPSFKLALEQSLQGRGRSSAVGDSWCLGFFSDNELAWGGDTSLAEAALQSPPDQPAKQAFLKDLKSKYDTIENLNRAWKTDHDSWAELGGVRTPPDREKARPDLEAFYSRLAEAYFRTVKDVLHRLAPGQLYLGCRFAWVNARAATAAAQYCDVVSYNLYRREVADFKFNGGKDVPLIIGEFHFGALDRGLFHTGLVPVSSQAERARAYENYVKGALSHPQFVGTHWFQYQDEPTTGRVYDEENYQIGFVDIADTPYRETIEASREIGAALYQYRAGE
jgi:hypothetical protein